MVMQIKLTAVMVETRSKPNWNVGITGDLYSHIFGIGKSLSTGENRRTMHKEKFLETNKSRNQLSPAWGEHEQW